MALAEFDTLLTERTVVRAVRHGDLPALLEINGDDETTRFLPYASWQGMADAEAWFVRIQGFVEQGHTRQLVVARREDDRVIGAIVLFRFDEDSARLELGYVFGRQYQGHGYAHEAVAATLAQAFGAMAIRRIEAEVNPANLPSCALVERLGFRLEGTLRQRWCGKGSCYDTRIYGLLASEFAHRPAQG